MMDTLLARDRGTTITLSAFLGVALPAQMQLVLKDSAWNVVMF